jgi:RNA recognition motif-containing protein
MNIYVANLNYQMTDDNLREIFEEYGEVSSAKVIIDKYSGRSRGFGFVEMPSDDDAQQAIDGLNNKEVMGKAINVNKAKPRTEERRRPGGGGGGQGGRSNFNRRY